MAIIILGKIVELGLSLNFNSNKSYVEPYRTDYDKYGYNGELKELLTSGEGFIPIGSFNDSETTQNFYGTFNGNNFTIYNLYLNKEIESGEIYQFYGLFAQNYGTIKNLKVHGNITINSESVNIHYGYIAGINMAGETIENCTALGNIKASGSSTVSAPVYMAIGGIVGLSRGTITRCNNAADIEGSGSRIYCGGIVGSLAKADVSKSYNVGKIEVKSSYDVERVGGIAAHFEKSNMTNCYNIGEVIGGRWSGALVGVCGSGNSLIGNCIHSNEMDAVGEGDDNVSLTMNQVLLDTTLTEERIKALLND